MHAIRTLVPAVIAGLGIAASVQCTDVESFSNMAEAPSVVRGNSEFALDLYRRLADEHEGNIFISPQSVSTALAMTYAGARGETAEQMASTLRFGLPPDELHRAFAALGRDLRMTPGDGPDVELVTANRLWGQRDMEFREAFLATARDHYDGGFETVDFRGATEEARLTINQWVETQTRERIRDLIQPGDLDETFVTVLTNAIYFKGAWALRFDEKLTRDDPFHVGPDETVTVPFMRQEAKFPVFRSDEVQIVELPYDGERLSMVLVVPSRPDALAELESSLTLERLDGWLAKLFPSEQTVILPRFTLESRFRLERTLAKMGMPLAFIYRVADFSGMCCAPGDVFIDFVIHQSFVEVNEEGTEAAAATAVGFKYASSNPPPIRADRPFMFLIRDRQTGAILFMGRVVDPS